MGYVSLKREVNIFSSRYLHILPKILEYRFYPFNGAWFMPGQSGLHKYKSSSLMRRMHQSIIIIGPDLGTISASKCEDFSHVAQNHHSLVSGTWINYWKRATYVLYGYTSEFPVKHRVTRQFSLDYLIVAHVRLINLGFSAMLLRHFILFLKVLFRHSPLPWEFHTSIIILEIVKQFLI